MNTSGLSDNAAMATSFTILATPILPAPTGVVELVADVGQDQCGGCGGQCSCCSGQPGAACGQCRCGGGERAA
jgi:hypothetical protein